MAFLKTKKESSQVVRDKKEDKKENIKYEDLKVSFLQTFYPQENIACGNAQHHESLVAQFKHRVGPVMRRVDILDVKKFGEDKKECRYKDK